MIKSGFYVLTRNDGNIKPEFINGYKFEYGNIKFGMYKSFSWHVIELSTGLECNRVMVRTRKDVIPFLDEYIGVIRQALAYPVADVCRYIVSDAYKKLEVK